ncbi:uncharacterized protein [Oscarella lobularis]|uniref:uncharacterized protein n=1 Tax=Oscarella lobularis TaxID=121494 RepID=UPI0033138825
MEGKLFGGRNEDETAALEAIKARSLSLCEKEHDKLVKCFRETWFGICHQEHAAFWHCFHRHRDSMMEEYVSRRNRNELWTDDTEQKTDNNVLN